MNHAWMSWDEWLSLLALASAGSFTPGPNTALSAALAAQGGVPAALRFVLAVPIGWALLLALCSTTLGTVVQGHPLLRQALQGLSATYLCWLAWRLWSAGNTLSRSGPARVGFLQGVWLQLLNGKAWMLAMAVVGGWIAPSTDPLLRALQVVPVLMVFGLVSNLAYACLGSALGERAAVVRALAVLLAATALWVALS